MEGGTIQLVPMHYSHGLDKSGILSMMYMPHFSHTVEVDRCMKKLLVCFHGGCLWLDNHIFVDIDLIVSITELSKEGVDPVPFFAIKEQDTILVA